MNENENGNGNKKYESDGKTSRRCLQVKKSLKF